MNTESTPPPQPGQPRVENAERAPGATASLVLGILSICCFWIFTAIPAIVVGTSARKKIALSGGALGGEGLALGGIITGAIGIIVGITPWAIAAAIMVPAFVGVKDKAEQAREINELRTINISCMQYAIDNDGKFPLRLQDLNPDYIVSEDVLTYEDESGATQSYRYRPGLTNSGNPNEPILLGRKDRRGRQPVLYTDGSVRTLPPGETLPPDILAEFE